jgi:hypothetical protein
MPLRKVCSAMVVVATSSCVIHVVEPWLRAAINNMPKIMHIDLYDSLRTILSSALEDYGV